MEQVNRRITSCRILFKLRTKFNRHCATNSFPLIDGNQSTKEASPKHNALPFNKLPGATGVYKLPLLGSMLQIAPFTEYGKKDIVKRVESWHQEYGDIFRMRLGNSWAVYVFNPDDIMAIYRQDGKYPHRITFELNKAYSRRSKRELGLLDLNDEEWHRVRQPTQQKMLRPEAVAGYLPVIKGVADDFIAFLRENRKEGVDDIHHLVMRYATECVGMLCFNKRLGCFNSTDVFDDIASDLRDALQLFGDSIFHVLKPYRWFKTPHYNRYEAKLNKLYSIAINYVEEATTILQSTSEIATDISYKEPNLLKDLLSDPRMTKDQVTRVLFELFFTGIHTTSNSMTFLLYQLAKHQEVQQKLFDEVNKFIPEDGRLNEKCLRHMTYLHACLKESLRVIYPLMIGSTRELKTDAVIGGYNIPQGTIVFTCSMFSALDERNFEHPKDFIPERWLRDREGKRHFHPFSTLPFGFGSRSCLGQRFAEQEIYIGISKLIKSFRIRLPPDGKDIQYVYYTFATTNAPFAILLERR